MTHREQVSVLSRMHLQQAEEVKTQSQEIHCLLALVEQQQEAIQRFMGPHSPPREPRAVPSCSESQLDAMQEEVCNLVPGTVNTMHGTAASHNTMIPNTPMVNQTSFEDMLAEEAHSRSNHQPKHIKFLCTTEGHFASFTPLRHQEEVALQPTTIAQDHPGEISFHVAACKFRKMWEPKNSKLKSGYSSSAGLVFQSWLKDIHVHVEDRQLMQREAIQLVKDFTTEHAQDKVEFYMGMVAKGDQSCKGLMDHLHDAFQSGEMLIELISDFYSQSQQTRETEDTFADDLQVLGRKIIVQKTSFHKEANQQLKAQYVHKLQDQYYAAMACSALLSSPEDESFTKFQGHLVTMFGGHPRQSQPSASSATTTSIDS